MMSVILYFILLCLFFAIVIATIRESSGKERLEWIKLIGFSILCGVLAFSTLVAIVLLF